MSTAAAGPAHFVLVATPIGNLDDLSPRAVETLAAADLVACEDTRRTGRLLAHAGVVGADLLRLDEHIEERAATEVIRRLDDGGTVALVSDAGMPGISDPGERVVRRVVEAGHRIEVVPGPSAPVAAVAGSVPLSFLGAVFTLCSASSTLNSVARSVVTELSGLPPAFRHKPERTPRLIGSARCAGKILSRRT